MKATTSKYASYIYVKEGEKVSGTKSLTNGIYLDYNEEGELVGIEILSPLEVEKQEG